MKSNPINVLLLLVVCFFTFFINNKVIYTDIMESRNMITAREMVYDGHWMVPTMNGDLRLEKPPLPTWIAAGAEQLFPDNMGAQRAMAGLAATMLVFFFYGLGKELTRRTDFAMVASLVLCTCYNLILMGRTATWDIYCHAFMMGAIYFLFNALQKKGAQWGNFFGAGLFLGLSFMSKGPVSFFALLLPFLLSYLFFLQAPLRQKGKPMLLMLVVCLAVSSWWYLYIYLFHAQEAEAVLAKESSAWADHNVRPWHYYKTFFLETGIWALFTLTTLLFPYWTARLHLRKEYSFALCWMLFTVILLSLMPEKKNRYLLPMLIPASYTVGFLFNYWEEKFREYRSRGGKGLYRFNTILVTLVVFALPVGAYFFLYQKGQMSLTFLIIATVVLWILAAVMLSAVIKLKPYRFVGTVVVLFIAAECFGMQLIGGMVNNPDYKSIRETRAIEELKELPFYHVAGKELRIELVNEAGKKILPLEVTQTEEVMKALPCAILTHEHVGEEMPSILWDKVDTVWVDQYDNNRRPSSMKRFSSDEFRYNVTILKLKEGKK